MLKRSAVLFLTFVLFISAASMQQATAGPRTIIVPDNYPTITQAIANAAAGDTIYVRNGVYNESYFEINKPITICGEDVRNNFVSITPTIESVYSSYFNRTYYYPDDAIIINSDNVKISGLTINSTGGITGNGDKVQLVSNIITLGKTCSLTGSEINIERNTLNGDDWQVTGSKLTLTTNRVNATNHSISVNASYCNLYGNNILGTLVVWGSMNTITHNSYDLMFIFYGDYNTIQGNSGEISLGNSNRSCSNNIISGNVMKGPSVWGIWIGSTCRNNVFYDNYIVDQGYTPYDAEYNSGVCICNLNGGNGLNNTFYHNAFINNSANIKFYSDYNTGGNVWDKSGVGNYWSDYNGVDADRDSVGDTPYVINSENRDNYPLAAPFDAPIINIALPVYDQPINLGTLVSPQSTATPTVTPTPSPAKSTPPTSIDITGGTIELTPEIIALAIVLLASAIAVAVLVVARRRGTAKA
jgi:nitrous oxidase accessory protein NosD